MMRHLPQYALMCALTVTLLAKCSGPSEAEENTPLNVAETESLLNGIMVVLADTTPEITAIHSAGEVTIACPEGGEARVTITTSDSVVGDTARITSDIGAAPASCALKGSDGTVFVLDANPGLNFYQSVTIVGFFESLTVEGGLTGQVDWKADDRNGTCSFDMDLEAAPVPNSNPPAFESSLSGDACGHELRLDVTDVVQTSARRLEEHLRVAS